MIACLRPLAVLTVVAALPAQGVFQGNGIPSAYVENSPARVGGSLTVGFGSPTTPNGLCVVSISSGFGPFFVPHPLIGLVAIDPLAPGYETFFFGLDGNGHGSVTVPVPPAFAATTPPLFANALTFEGPLWSFSKTVRIDWADADGWEAAGNLLATRQLHSATALGRGPRDNVTEVLICGGATGSIVIPTPMASAELYSPLTRQTTALPNLSLPRASHRAVRFEGGPLQGMVLITGGVTTGGVVTATCELFEPGSGQFLPVPPMVAPRAGHAITLLDDGRVLVTGGVADWQNAATAFVAALNTTQRSAELFDPQTYTWTQLPDMFEPRFGHTQTKLLDGRVLVVSGIGGGFTGTNPVATPGQMPFYSYSCEVFDPATLTFQPTTSLGPVPTSPFFRLNGRGFHGASLLPNGHVLITGGFVNGTQNGEAVPTETCGEWDGTSWVLAAPLAIPRAFHTQVEFGGGALLTGGFVGDLTQLLTTAVVTRHDVASVTDLAPIGTDGLAGSAAPRATHTCTPLYDGTMLIYGGAQWPLTLGDGWIYTPN